MPNLSHIDASKLIYNAGFEATQRYKLGRRTRSSAPKVKLVVSPFLPPFVPIEILGADVGDLIINAEWEKSRSVPAGTFTITMLGDDKKFSKAKLGYPIRQLWSRLGVSIRDIFKPMTFAKLYVDGYLIMTGYMLACRKSTAAGSPSTYTMSFVELGELFNHQIVSYKFMLSAGENNLAGNPNLFEKGAVEMSAMPLFMTIKYLVSAFLSSTMALSGKNGILSYLKWADGLPASFRFIAQPSPLGGIAFNSYISSSPSDLHRLSDSGGQTFWDFLKTLAPEPIMELFTETAGRTICIQRLNPVMSGNPATIFKSIAGGISARVPGIGVTPILPGFSYLICRSTPYDNPLTGISPYGLANYAAGLGAFDLIGAGDFVIVTDNDVISKNLGVSQEQQYTSFTAHYARGKGAGDLGDGYHPVYATGSLIPIYPGGQRTFGNRVYETQIDMTSTNWSGFAGEKTNSMIWSKFNPISGLNLDVVATQMAVWLRNASKYMEGTISSTGMAYARPGMMLLYLDPKNGQNKDQRENGMYYIDNIHGSVAVGETDKMDFSVIRGTPIPLDSSKLKMLLLDWDILPVFSRQFT